MKGLQKEILLVDPYEYDYRQLKEVVRQLAAKVGVSRLISGRQAMQYLNKQIDQLPCLILIDDSLLSPPLDLLKKLTEDTRFLTVPVVVWGRLWDRGFIELASDVGMERYFQKSVIPSAFKVLVKEILELCHL